jgi:hypothetical protein
VLSFCHFIWTASKIESTEDIEYPDPEPNAVNPNEKTTLLEMQPPRIGGDESIGKFTPCLIVLLALLFFGLGKVSHYFLLW